MGHAQGGGALCLALPYYPLCPCTIIQLPSSGPVFQNDLFCQSLDWNFYSTCSVLSLGLLDLVSQSPGDASNNGRFEGRKGTQAPESLMMAQLRKRGESLFTRNRIISH
jgi:hypothetical protein